MVGPWRSVQNDHPKIIVILISQRIVRFGIVGIANTVIGLLCIYSVIFFFHFGPATANATGYAFGLIVSFILNRIWTFEDKKSNVNMISRYIVVVIFSYGLNLTIVLMASRLMHVGPYLVQVFGIGIYAIAMFIGCHRFVFR